MAEAVIKATVVLHNVLTVPSDATLNEVVEQVCIYFLMMHLKATYQDKFLQLSMNA